MKWKIDKSFSFAYGHRVHNQSLNSEFSVDSCLACRHLHGHEGLVKIHLESEKLDQGMVTDFKHLNWFKVFLDDVLDHKFIMDINDPLVPHEVPEYTKFDHKSGTTEIPVQVIDLDKFIYDTAGFWVPDLREITERKFPDAVFEKYEGMVFVNFVPTSENLSAWLLEIAQKKMAQMGVKVVAVEFWETPKSHCKVEV